MIYSRDHHATREPQTGAQRPFTHHILRANNADCDTPTDGNSARCPDHQCKNGTRIFRAFSDGYADYIPTDSRYIGYGIGLSDIAAAGSLNELAGVINLQQQNSTRLTDEQVAKLGSNLDEFLGEKDCGKYINAMLLNLPDNVAQTTKFTKSLKDVFNRVKDGGGFWSGDTMGMKSPGIATTDPNTLTTTFDIKRIVPLITGESWQQLGATDILVHELTHVFTQSPNAGVFQHLAMAQAASNGAVALGLDVKKDLHLDFPDR